MLEAPRILIACIGNIFLGDDAFGCEVARKLADRSWPDSVRVVDFGIRGFDLVYALLDGYEITILVDAVPRGGAPGTIYVVQPQVEPGASSPPADLLDAHAMDPEKVLRLAMSLGARIDGVLLVGCEPSPLDEQDMQDDLSEPVQAAIDEAVELIAQTVARVTEVAQSGGDATIAEAIQFLSNQEKIAR